MSNSRTLHEDLLDLQIPQSIQISPNKTDVVYSTGLTFHHRIGDHTVSTIWLAKVGQSGSAKQLTNGSHFDRDPKWSADGRSIAFLSDRAKAGQSTALYMLNIGGGDPYPLTSTENKRSIDTFEFSPDGNSIAFISADEKIGEKADHDIQIWGQEWAFNRLRLVDVATKTVTTIVKEDFHITAFSWHGREGQVAFASTDYPGDENSALYGTKFHIVNAVNRSVRQLCIFPTRIGNLVSSEGSLYFIGQASDMEMIAATMVYKIDLEVEPTSYSCHAHGIEDCAKALVKRGKSVIVHVELGTENRLSFLNGKTVLAERKHLTGWDVTFNGDHDDAIVVAALSSTNKASEVYSRTQSSNKLIKLSEHGKSISKLSLGSGTCISCPSSDNRVTLEAVWHTPPAHEKRTTSLPTVVMIHGGPYSRLTDSFDNSYFMWGPVLLDAGYALLIPNYRGGSGRGDEFAAYARGAGKYDYEDVITLTQHAITKGLADPNRLVVGGWSFGGFLTNLCAVRNGLHGYGWKFQAALSGAGISDMDTCAMSSDIGFYWTEIAGKQPWQCEKGDTDNRQSSAIWEFHSAVKTGGVIPPMLILHGGNDARVPLEQAQGMRRALQAANLLFEYVVYAGEGHVLSKRKNLLDAGNRILAFVEKHIGSSSQ